jgi:hypothetical protein
VSDASLNSGKTVDRDRCPRSPDVISVQQPPCSYAEGLCEFLDNGDGGIAAAALDVADIGAVNAGAVGIVLLAPALLPAEAADVFAKARADVHARLMRPLSSIDLQTISDISR